MRLKTKLCLTLKTEVSLEKQKIYGLCYSVIYTIDCYAIFFMRLQTGSKASLKPSIHWRTADSIFKQFCPTSKLQRTVNPLCLSYPIFSVRRPQFSSLDPPSLGTTKGLPPFGIPTHSYILIF